MTVTILTNLKEDYGVYLDIGAKTKSRSPSYPEYNWVQWVTTNAIQRQYKKYLKADVPFLDPPRPEGAPPYYSLYLAAQNFMDFNKTWNLIRDQEVGG